MPRITPVGTRRSFWGFLLFLVVLALWLRAPATATNAAREALALCANVMIPTLFPLFVLSNLFVRRQYYRYVAAVLRPVMQPLFGLGASGAGALALGAVGGYPIGAATAFSLYDSGQLTKRQTQRLLCFCNNAGPAYMFGVVGLGVLGSVRAGAMVYLAHLLAAALVGVGCNALSGPLPAPMRLSAVTEPAAPFSTDFVASVKAGLQTILTVCAFACFFAVLLSFLSQSGLLRLPMAALGLLGLDGETAQALLFGAVELTAGVSALPPDCAGTVLLSVCSFLLGWGGLCVHCQVLALRADRPLVLRGYFLGKLAQGLLAAVLVQLLCRAAMGALLAVVLAAALALIFFFVKKTAGKKLRHRV